MKLMTKLQLIIGGIFTLIIIIIKYTIGDIILVNNYSVNLLILLPLSIIVFLFISYDLFIESVEEFKEKNFFNEITLTLIASIAAFFILEFAEALAVSLFFKLGESFEDYAKDKSKDSLKSILELKPDYANLLVDGIETKVDPEQLKLGDILLVKPGEKVPVDGIIIEGSTSLNTSSISGESLPKDVNVNDIVISGTINITNVIKIKVTKEYKDSTINKILEMVNSSNETKTKQEKFITKFSKIYTPIVISLAFGLAIIPPLIIGLAKINGENISNFGLWRTWINVGCSFLVISCPCSLLLSVPLSFYIGIGVASKYKAIVKGTVYLEELNNISTIALDKTGTITKGNFEIQSYTLNKNYTFDELFTFALIGEKFSNHPIALAIKSKYIKDIDDSNIKDYKVELGKGTSLLYSNNLLLVGNDKLMKENNISFKENDSVGTIVYVAYNNNFIGSICIADTVKEDSKEALNSFKKQGVKHIVMLTGDQEKNAKYIANQLNIEYSSNLLPDEKAIKINELQQNKNKVLFVGDGINDTVSMVKADIGVSMGNIGSDAAIESSDIILMDDKLSTLVKVKKISRLVKNKAVFNIVFSLIIKFGMMIFSILNSSLNLNYDGIIIWLAIFSDVGVTIICVLNSMSLMIKKIK